MALNPLEYANQMGALRGQMVAGSISAGMQGFQQGQADDQQRKQQSLQQAMALRAVAEQLIPNVKSESDVANLRGIHGMYSKLLAEGTGLRPEMLPQFDIVGSPVGEAPITETEMTDQAFKMAFEGGDITKGPTPGFAPSERTRQFMGDQVLMAGNKSLKPASVDISGGQNQWVVDQNPLAMIASKITKPARATGDQPPVTRPEATRWDTPETTQRIMTRFGITPPTPKAETVTADGQLFELVKDSRTGQVIQVRPLTTKEEKPDYSRYRIVDGRYVYDLKEQRWVNDQPPDEVTHLGNGNFYNKQTGQISSVELPPEGWTPQQIQANSLKLEEMAASRANDAVKAAGEDITPQRRNQIYQQTYETELKRLREQYGNPQGQQPPAAQLQVQRAPRMNVNTQGALKPAGMTLHHTAGGTTESNIQTLTSTNNPRGRVSAHYLIGKDGKVVQIVEDNLQAMHDVGSNRNNLGVELVNAGDGKDPYTPAQMRALAQLIASKMQQHGFTFDQVVGHTGRNEPRGMDWGALRQMVDQIGGTKAVAGNQAPNPAQATLRRARGEQPQGGPQSPTEDPEAYARSLAASVRRGKQEPGKLPPGRPLTISEEDKRKLQQKPTFIP